MSNTIVLKGQGIRKELAAAAAITPGHLVERTAAGTVQVHAVAGGNMVPAFAVENEIMGQDITKAYATGDNTLFEVMVPGSEINALAINGTSAIASGAFLQSDGAGGVETHVVNAAFSNAIIGKALEAVDNSGGSVPVRIKIEVL